MGCGAISGTEDVLKPELEFRKVKSIHKNESSEIWTCQNQNNEKFSIKVFKKIYINDESQTMLKNFQQEINRLFGLTENNNKNKQDSNLGKHLMPYFRAWKDENGNLSLIMKYIEEKSLADEVKGKLPGVFSYQQIAKFTEQILLTIKYLRKNTSIFCNIKPTNIFLDKKRENVILTDFYNLEEYFNLTQTNIFNNPMYSAPENVLFNQYFQETDIWRVGCFVIEMITCIKPWYKETISNEKIIQNLKNMQRPPIPENIPVSGKNFLEKCFETDHNKRISLEDLLNHEFLLKNIERTEKPSQVDNEKKYERENTEVEEIASYNFEVQIIEETPRREKLSKRMETERTNLESLSSRENTLNFRVPRKKASSNYLSGKTYQTSNVIISQNDENCNESMGDLKKSKNFRTKRIKTDTNERNYVSNSPYVKKNSKQEIISLFSKKKNSKLIGQSFEVTNENNLSISRKISKTSDNKLGTSKKKIPTNQITLNNQVIAFNENSSTKYWPVPEIPAPFDSSETAERLTKVMKEIEMSGGPRYYKRPLKLLKQKIRDKTYLRTETSLTFEDSHALLEKSAEDIEEIDLEASNNVTTEDYPNQSEVSKISVYPEYENRVIETLVSKAYKDRIELEQKMLKEQREKEKVKWERELQEGREFIKKEINKRYYLINKTKEKSSKNSEHF